ncbi:hypothetical protein L2E82_24950 [Cichorium intybus]|uniref:Uncharacterized protein n=1 Tax=Cichorium intybus TaxID=13427 RepID=A0ACB9E1T6_CICIN|nr:hypothetical protein L2E82_24950 [Cichorium intybus]
MSPVMGLLVTSFFLYSIVKLIRRRSSGKVDTKLLPPGPWKLPFIGNMFSMVSSELPHHVLRNLARKHGALMHLQLGEISALVVSSRQMAKEILVKHDLSFASRPELLVSKTVVGLFSLEKPEEDKFSLVLSKHNN